MEYSNSLSTLPQIKGYRIIERVHNDQQQNQIKQTNLKVAVQNSSNGIPRIRHDVICHGKLYPLIPLFTFTSQDDLKIVQQLSAIVLKDQNQVLCDILTKKDTQVKSSQFMDLKQRMKNIFGLQLKIQPQQLFLLVISDQITSQKQFNIIFDSISQSEFINLIKKIFQNCTKKLIPKILRKFNKYFTSTKNRLPSSIQRLKRYLKIVKSCQQNQNQQEQYDQQEQKDHVQLKKQSIKIQSRPQLPTVNKIKKISQKQVKKEQQKKQYKEVILKQTQKIIKKQSSKKQKQISKRTLDTQQSQKSTTVLQTQTKEKSKTKNILSQFRQKQEPSKPKNKRQSQKATPTKQQKQQEWQDQQSSDNHDIDKSLQDMAYDQDSDQDLKYVGPKKKNNAKKNNITIPLDPQFQRNLGKKPQRLKKQKNNHNNNQNNNNNNKNNQKTYSNNKGNNKNNNNYQKSSPIKQGESQINQKRSNFRGNNRSRNNGNNGGNNTNDNNNGNQNGGRREWSKQNKKVDQRILLGINGGSDSMWRQRMRPYRIPKQQNFVSNRRPFDNNGKRQNRSQNAQNSKNQSLIVTKISQKKENQTKKVGQQTKNKNLQLQRVFSIPDDVQNGKKFLFENRNYNIFVNKLFWVNISQGQITIQKQSKGYIRKCNVQIIDGGKGIMGQGLTLNIDGLSNLQDGGTPFGDPKFQQFTPEGQWFHISSLEIYAYV